MKSFREDEEAPPKSRRELRLERQRKKRRSGLTGLLAHRRASGREAIRESFREDEEASPKSRRELRLERQRRKRNKRGGVNEFFVTILVAFALVFGLVRPFIVEAFSIPSESMVPTLEIGDRVLANKFIYSFTEPKRGDIVIFQSVEEGDDETLIKRVVGIGGDEIRVQDGLLYVNGKPQKEPYLNQEDPFSGFYGPTKVPQGHIFVMGDNRNNSADSRVFGPVPLENLKGKAFLRFWPLSEIGPLTPGNNP